MKMAQLLKTHYEATTSYKLIYVFCVHDHEHVGMLKIGDASINTSLLPNQLPPNVTKLNQAAKDRINQYSVTLGIRPRLLHTELAIKEIVGVDGKKSVDSFRDYDVHKVLTNSGIEKVHPNDTNANEWFKTDLETAKNAIKAVKEGRKSLQGGEITDVRDIEIILREEQEEAIKKTIEVFKHGNQMLWNAKMRYGKTITSLSFVKRQLDKYKKTLIITHRPVVESGWRDDFNLIFKDGECYFARKEYETDNPEESSRIDIANEQQLRQLQKDGNPFIYFASIQDLRGSKRIGGRFNKNNTVFDIEWDLIINDEAHEGTQTQLGQKVASAIKKGHTKLLSLSGTPFNIMSQYDDEAVYTWDYVMEQARKKEWDKTHPGDPNPYAALPQMHIYTYNLGDIIRGYSPEIEGKAFNFTEFFRTWTGDPQRDGKEVSQSMIGDFVHKSDIEKFLHLITTESNDSAYPFSTQEYRDMFRHTLWMIPGVKEAKALSKLLREHPVFGNGNFGIANVAGEGDDYEEIHAQDALQLVKDTIKDNDYSITLSCGKLTTGVTIKEWTACFMLSGSYMTAAAGYLQTIFRVQSPGGVNGKTKEHCYVFDFAPDRTLRVVAEAAKVSRKGGTGGTGSDEERRKIMAQFLNFCPVIAISGTNMKPYSVDNMMQQIKHIYAERAINSGFEDSSIYNERLMSLDKLEIADFEALKKIIGSTKANKPTGEVPVNDQGFTEEQYEQLQQLKKKNKRTLTEEEKAALEALKKQKEERTKAESILRGVSVRMPLLIFGADVPFEEDITIERFVELVDDASWNEFMPKGVTKALFRKFIKYYDKDVFVAAAKEIRLKAKVADGLLPTDRVQQIALIHSKFKNPDKETVLTPWRVVNMHMSDCLGGYCFYDESFSEDNKLEIPRFVDRGGVTVETLANPNVQILEINSKTGLYPLYVAYSIYRTKCAEYETTHKGCLTDIKQQELWATTVSENLYIICKTPMAKAITKRTLIGYNALKINAHCFDDLVGQLRNKPDHFIKKVMRGSFWNKEVSRMVFDAIVGNPPYQAFLGGASPLPIYHHFVEQAINMKPKYVSMITPARWFNTGTGLDNFRANMLNDDRLRQLHDYINANECFPNVEIKGGIQYFLWDKGFHGKCTIETHNEDGSVDVSIRNMLEPGMDSFIRDSKMISILEKVRSFNEKSFSELLSSRDPFGYDIRLPGSMKVAAHKFSLKKDAINDVEFYYNGWRKEGVGYVALSSVNDNKQWVDKHKVLISKAWGTGNETKDWLHPFIVKPHSVCTETYIVVGPFDSEAECKNVISYISTRFFHTMVSLLKISQNAAKGVYELVPIQDFSRAWTDHDLYEKYGLTDEEIALIENKIKIKD